MQMFYSSTLPPAGHHLTENHQAQFYFFQFIVPIFVSEYFKDYNIYMKIYFVASFVTVLPVFFLPSAML